MPKIIWTNEELITISDAFPLAEITVELRSGTLVEEVFPRDGTIRDIIVSYPGGCRCLVTVMMRVMRMEEEALQELLLPPLVGDNQVFYLNMANYVKSGNKLQVDIRNNDSEFEHTVGVRVDVF